MVTIDGLIAIAAAGTGPPPVGALIPAAARSDDELGRAELSGRSLREAPQFERTDSDPDEVANVESDRRK